jgi:hypothetical protein
VIKRPHRTPRWILITALLVPLSAVGQSLTGTAALNGNAFCGSVWATLTPATPLSTIATHAYGITTNMAVFPASGTLYSCSATPSSLCPDAGHATLGPDHSTPLVINGTLLHACIQASGDACDGSGHWNVGSGKTLTATYTWYVAGNATQIGDRINGAASAGSCTSCVTGDGVVTVTNSVYSLPDGSLLGTATHTCNTATCLTQGPNVTWSTPASKQVKIVEVFTLASASSGAATPYNFGQHVK